MSPGSSARQRAKEYEVSRYTDSPRPMPGGRPSPNQSPGRWVRALPMVRSLRSVTCGPFGPAGEPARCRWFARFAPSRADRSCGVAGDAGPGGDVAEHDRARPDDGAVADGDALQDRRVGPDPHVIADDHRCGGDRWAPGTVADRRQ